MSKRKRAFDAAAPDFQSMSAVQALRCVAQFNSQVNVRLRIYCGDDELANVQQRHRLKQPPLQLDDRPMDDDEKERLTQHLQSAVNRLAAADVDERSANDLLREVISVVLHDKAPSSAAAASKVVVCLFLWKTPYQHE